MKVIDFHLHIGTNENFVPWVQDYFRMHNPDYYERFSKHITPEEIIELLKLHHVDRGVMLAEYNPCTGLITNEHTVAFCKGHKELIPFGAICFYDNTPYEKQAQYAVEELGVKGFKCLPSYQFFYPNDPTLFPFYDYVQSLRLPIMFHTGSSIFKGTRIKYADPLLLDDVADEFPDLTIIMEHGGRPFWYDRAAWLITRHENMYIGTAGIPVRQLPKHFPNLEMYKDRFIFGSDWPGMADIKGLIARVLNLPVSDEAKEMILYKNAERILARTK
ncbi:MAG: amidohydrolase family protein [Pseudomonadota bacterium]